MKDKVLIHYQKIPFQQDIFRTKGFKDSLVYFALNNYNFNNKLICDIGCSTAFKGNYIRINYSGYKYLGIDFNLRALKKAYFKKNPVVSGNNMAIPLANECSDFTISEGVIHHTPNPYRSFEELIRITKKGGYLSLLVYNKNSYYFYFFKICWVFRFIYKFQTKLSEFIIFKVIFPIYYCIFVTFAEILMTKEKVPLKEALSSFHDQVLNPSVYFFQKDEINTIADKNGLIPLNFKKKLLGKSLLYLFKKI